MTDEMIQKLDDYATEEVRRLGINVKKHEFFISNGPYYKKRRTCDVIRLEPRQFYQTLTEGAPKEDIGPALALMAETLYTLYIDHEIDEEKNMDNLYFLSDSMIQFMDDLQELWKLGIPGRIAWDPDYVYGGRLHPEDYCLIECRCGKLIMVPRYTGDLVLETTCPICDLPWQYQNEEAYHPYINARALIHDYVPLYDIPGRD